MKKICRNFVACLLAVLVAFSFSLSGFAFETEETTAVNIPEISEETVEDTADNNEDEIVATVSLCSVVYVWPISGHTFIYVHNNSDEPIQVGHYEVPVGQGVSIGAFSFSVHDGWGIYYNIEGFKENTKGRMDKVWSKSKDINARELEKLTAELKAYPNYWGFVANCATFAFAMWNSVSGDHFFSLLIPAISQFMLMVGGGKKGVLEMYCPERNQIFRQKGFGSNAHLEIASDGTIS